MMRGRATMMQAAALLAARRGAPVHTSARTAPPPPRPEANARALLQPAAAAAITCNLNGRSPGGAASGAARARRGGARRGGARWLLTHLGFATWLLRSPLGLPLRKRIHLETLVFLSMDYCATAPHVVADVILQVPPLACARHNVCKRLKAKQGNLLRFPAASCFLHPGSCAPRTCLVHS